MKNILQNSLLPIFSKGFNIDMAILLSIKEATRRARKVMLFICFAVLMVFAYSWESHSGSWLVQRVKTIEKAILWEQDSTVLLENGMAFKDVQSHLKAYELYQGLSLDDKNKKREELMKMIAERYSITIPILGVKFDINNLGFLGGVFLSVLITLLFFSLQREHENLCTAKDVFKNYSPDVQYLYYQYMTTFQVLSIPHNTRLPKIYRYFGKSIVHSPIIIHSVVVIFDLITFKTGMVISQANTIFNTLVSFFALAILAFFTWKCLELMKNIDAFWDNIPIDLLASEASEMSGRLLDKKEELSQN